MILEINYNNDGIEIVRYIKKGLKVQGKGILSLGHIKKEISSGYAKVLVDQLLVNFSENSGINFKKHNIANIKTWIRKNVDELRVDQSIPSNVYNALLKIPILKKV
jgi:hypothetical protein